MLNPNRARVKIHLDVLPAEQDPACSEMIDAKGALSRPFIR
jgi:hypothetical protein